MFSKKYVMPALLLAGAMSLPLPAIAAQPGMYFGAGLGSGHDVVLDQDSSAGKLFFGFNVNPYIGMEVAYVNLGSNYTDFYGESFTQDGATFELVGNLPLSPYIDLFGKVGLFNWTVSSNYYYASTSGTDNTYGFGISAQVAPRLWLRGEYQTFMDVAGGDVDLISASLSFHF